VGSDGRLRSVLAIGAATAVGGATYLALLALTRSPDLQPLVRRGRSIAERLR
jgi:hypothetical protein